MSRILINATNLHVGDGVQVAASFICELATKGEISKQFSVWMSRVVYENVKSASAVLDVFSSVRVLDIKGRQSFPEHALRDLKGFDCVFTVFGPLYHRISARSIVGFAQPWIIYPNNECYSRLGLWSAFKLKLKFLLQRKYFAINSDVLVVEAEHVKERLVSQGVKHESEIFVVHNTVAALYFNESLWSNFSVDRDPSRISLGFIGRNYAHKNSEMIPSVKRMIESKYGLTVDFYVTFSDEEWLRCSDEFKLVAKNVGVLRVVDCPGFYSSLDGVFFPSLLECFSATPLEAMVMKRPVFLADRPFNRDVAQDYAFYFDPMSAESAADAIFSYFQLPRDVRWGKLNLAREHSVNFSSAAERADKYVDLIFLE